MSEEIKKIGKWLESTITDETPERLDEPFPVKVTGLDILRMRNAGLLPKGAELEVTEK
ncbi:hypothetical protein ES703_89138 [subsurface metagenome]